MHVRISTGSYQKYVKLSDNEVKQVMTATFETNLKIAQTIEEKNNALPKEKQIPLNIEFKLRQLCKGMYITILRNLHCLKKISKII